MERSVHLLLHPSFQHLLLKGAHHLVHTRTHTHTDRGIVENPKFQICPEHLCTHPESLWAWLACCRISSTSLVLARRLFSNATVCRLIWSCRVPFSLRRLLISFFAWINASCSLKKQGPGSQRMLRISAPSAALSEKKKKVKLHLFPTKVQM